MIRSMNEPAPLSLNVWLDRPRIARGAAQVVHLVAELVAPAAASGERAPLALVLAVDTSGSMEGEKLRHVVSSVEVLMSQLLPGDRLGIVCFSQAAKGVLPLRAVDRIAARAALARLDAVGGTNVEAGLRLAAGMLDGRGCVLLLSDGQPNAGALTPRTLAAVARELGVTVSTLGYGADHAEEVLLGLAEAGRGSYAYVPKPELCRVELARAVGAQAEAVATAVSLTLEPRRGVTVERVLGAPSVGGFDGAALEVPLADLLASERRPVAFALKLEPYLEAGPASLARLVLKQRAVKEVVVELKADVAEQAGPLDPAAHGLRLRCSAKDVRARATALAEARRFDEAKAELERVIEEIRRAPAGANGPELNEALEQLIDDAALMSQRPDAAAQAEFRRGQQAALPRPAMAAAASGPVPRARLIIVEGVPHAEVAMQREMVLGRTADADLQLTSPGVSRRHTRIVAADGAFWVNDLGSSNGTQLNGVPVRCERLRDGDLLQLGPVKLLYREA